MNKLKEAKIMKTQVAWDKNIRKICFAYSYVFEKGVTWDYPKKNDFC